MKINVTRYDNYEIRIKEGSSCALVYMGSELIQCIAGSLYGEGPTPMEKAKKYIDNLKGKL